MAQMVCHYSKFFNCSTDNEALEIIPSTTAFTTQIGSGGCLQKEFTTIVCMYLQNILRESLSARIHD